MTRSKTLALLALVLLIAAFFVVRWMNDFARVKQVDVGNTPLQRGVISKVVLTNRQSSKVQFMLRCYYKVRDEGPMLFSQGVTLPPGGSVEFEVNPDLAGRELPRIVANKACEAVWRGPFGIERSAWWVSWKYGKAAEKSIFR